jgi:nitrogen regulatory protein P-II 1
MTLKKVTAIVRCSSLETVEEALRKLHVPGLTITHVVGFGEYANVFKDDWTCRHARIELFVDDREVEAIVGAITEAAHSGHAGDGIVAILPVERLLRIRDRSELADRAARE